MKAELQEVMNMLRKLQGAIDFGNAPMAEREELAGDVTEIMDALFEVMKKLPDLERKVARIHACASACADVQGVAEGAASQKRAVRELVSVLRYVAQYANDGYCI